MRRMADRATLPHRLVLIDKRAALLRMTLEAGFVSTQESKAAGFERLLNIRAPAFNCDSLVHLVTIGAAHFAFHYWMVVRQLKCGANFQVTLETSFRRLSWIDNRASSTAGFDVQTPRPVTSLAAHVHRFLRSFAALSAGLTYDNLFCLQSRVGGCSEVAHDLFVTGRALLRANELRARDAGRGENCSVGGATGKQNDGHRYGSSGTPQQSLALTFDPSS
jgi:hypothetical protein